MNVMAYFQIFLAFTSDPEQAKGAHIVNVISFWADDSR
jgi:hypothetical protein